VFQIFGSKASLLEAVAVGSMETPEFGRLVQAMHQSDPVVAARETVEAGCAFWERHGSLAASLATLATRDADAAAALANREGARTRRREDAASR
jgi:hypothetical protein